MKPSISRNRFLSRFARSGLVLAWLAAMSVPGMAADKWLSIRSKNFLLVGNASESEIRRVGRTLEEFRSAVAMMFPKMEQTSAVPTTILVFRNDESFKPYKPLYKGQPSNALAFFQPGEDVNYIALTATLPSPNVILHEYVHFLLRENVGGLPLWISEGLAECYSTFELSSKQNEFTIGRPPDAHVATFSTPQQFIPLKSLLNVHADSPEYNEDSKQGMFYAESWAIVHYLVLGPNGTRRTQFSQLLAALAKGQSFDTAFGETFQTDYGTLEDEVREYIRKRSSWPLMKIVSKENLQVDIRSMTPATLSEPESEFYLGDLLLHLGRLPEAEPHLTAAVAKNANLAPAQVSLGVLRVRQKKYEDALSILKKAVDADTKNPFANFYYAYVVERADSDASAAVSVPAAERYETIRTYSKKALDLAPRFVESYSLLARANLNAGENLEESESTLTKALAIAPGRDDIQMLLAQTYLRANRRDDARRVLSIIEQSAANPETRRRATALLDQTEQTVSFTEITPQVEKEIAAERPAVTLPAQPSATLPPVLDRRAQETVLEPLTPTAPAVEGEKITGQLTNMDCSNGLTLTVQTDRTTMELHSSEPEKIQFLSYTAEVTDNVKCGSRNPPIPVTVTYRRVSTGSGEPLVIEFLEKK